MITSADFIRVWQKSQSLVEVVAELGVSLRKAQQRATYLRKCGIELKKFQSRTGRPAVSVEDFIRVWQSSSCHKEVCERLNMTGKNIAVRATTLRSLGVPLKRMKPYTPKLDIPALAQLAKSLDPRSIVTTFEPTIVAMPTQITNSPSTLCDSAPLREIQP